MLERGEPMTLADVAGRFEEVGIVEHSRALLSLQRCEPGAAAGLPEGDLYHLDPHDERPRPLGVPAGAYEARAMVLGSTFLLIVGAGPLALDAALQRRRRP
ncbi:MAG: hypothetical protein IPH07_25205 [Deltaproteobacteria bacterium]|nr:hypothetical protein [Deltaproteobacteria bacterium]